MICATVKLYIETDDGEEACQVLHSGLANQLHDFPAGEVLMANVDHFDLVSKEEERELGLDEG